MESPKLNPETLLTLMQAVLAEVPAGLLLLDATGQPLWFNAEAALACSVWHHGEQTGAALRLSAERFAVPPALWHACQRLAATWHGGRLPLPMVVSTPERGLHARITLQVLDGTHAPAFFLFLDYRRPRVDRDRPLSREALGLLSRLSPREREVALQVRDGLSTAQIAARLKRSPLTIKTQLAGIFEKLGVNRRSLVTAMLNR